MHDDDDAYREAENDDRLKLNQHFGAPFFFSFMQNENESERIKRERERDRLYERTNERKNERKKMKD